MKKKVAFLLFILTVASLFAFAGCTDADKFEYLTEQDVLNAYNDPAYKVYVIDRSDALDSGLFAYEKYVKVEKGDDYAMFYICKDLETAKIEADENRWNLVLWVYSLVNGKPIWVNTERFGKIVAQYENADLVQPFKEYLAK